MFRTTIETIPRKVPYLSADPADVPSWQQRLAGDSNRIKVGLAWAGRKTLKNDRNRSMNLSMLAPLRDAGCVSFYSLQKGDRRENADSSTALFPLIDHTAELQDFADTAALIANLDLVIAVDTAIVHLAGALGKPVWVMLPFAADWRWLLDRQDSPWYPTMRLFRQPAIGDWQSVVERVASDLANL